MWNGLDDGYAQDMPIRICTIAYESGVYVHTIASLFLDVIYTTPYNGSLQVYGICKFTIYGSHSMHMISRHQLLGAPTYTLVSYNLKLHPQR